MIHDPCCFVEDNPLMRQCVICEAIEKARLEERDHNGCDDAGRAEGYSAGFQDAARDSLEGISAIASEYRSSLNNPDNVPLHDMDRMALLVLARATAFVEELIR